MSDGQSAYILTSYEILLLRYLLEKFMDDLDDPDSDINNPPDFIGHKLGDLGRS